MIDFLSNADWINPQLDYLNLLQTIRTEHFENLDKLFLSITILGEIQIPVLICSILYWCIDFKSGVYIFSLLGFDLMFTQFFKMIACVYRPWILSDKIHPVELAVPAARGYSFPSGHSATASSVLGGLALLYKKNKFLCIFLIFIVLCVGFSRMWLGVHTPQDVVVGLIIGTILVFWLHSIIEWAEINKNRYIYLLVITNLLAIFALLYICYFNQYPRDYINGELLVNPLKSVYAAINCYGVSLGLVNGAFLCRRFSSFDAKKGSLRNKVMRGVIGLLTTSVLLKSIGGYIAHNMLDFKVVLVISMLLGLYVTLFYPLIISKFIKD